MKEFNNTRIIPIEAFLISLNALLFTMIGITLCQEFVPLNVKILLFFIVITIFSVLLQQCFRQYSKRTHLIIVFFYSISSAIGITFLFAFIYLYWYPASGRFPTGSLAAKFVQFFLSLAGIPSTANQEIIAVQSSLETIPVKISTDKASLFAILLYWGNLSVQSLFCLKKGKDWLYFLLIITLFMPVYLIFRLSLWITLLISSQQFLYLDWNPLFTFLTLLPLPLILFYFLAGKEKLMWNCITDHKQIKGPSAMLSGVLIFLGFFAGFKPAWFFPTAESTETVLIDDAHSDWAWATESFSPDSWGLRRTYTYSSFRDLLARYYKVIVNKDDEITLAMLSGQDVVILKTPTRPYSQLEIKAIIQYVQNGGNVLLIGDHTNLFGMTVYLNELCRNFGIKYRTDDTFTLMTGKPLFYHPPFLWKHPVDIKVRDIQFLTGCTLLPQKLPAGTPQDIRFQRWLNGNYQIIMAMSQQGREEADYSHINFFNNIFPDASEEAGRFILSLSTTYGKGRIVAFTDSTIFSDFSLYYYDLPCFVINLIEETGRPVMSGLLLLLLKLIVWGILIFLTIFIYNNIKKATGIMRRKIIIVIPFYLALGLFSGGLCTTCVTNFFVSRPDPCIPVKKIAFINDNSNYQIPGMLNDNMSLDDQKLSFDNFFINCQRMGLQPVMAKNLHEGLHQAEITVLINPSLPLHSRIDAQLSDWCKKGGTALILHSASSTKEIKKDLSIIESGSLHSIAEDIKIEARIETLGNGRIIYISNGTAFNRFNLGAVSYMPSESQMENNRLQFTMFYLLNLAEKEP